MGGKQTTRFQQQAATRRFLRVGFVILTFLITFGAVPFALAQEPLPTPLAGGEILYIVVGGDTLDSIAEKFAVPLETILGLNGLLADSPLKVGQRLILGLTDNEPAPPPTEPPPVIEATPPPVETPIPAPVIDLFRSTPTPQPDGRIIYIVQTGDTLVSIGVRFGFTLDELYAVSGLNADSLLTVGQEIELGQDQGAVVPLEGNVPPRYAGATYREADNAYVHTVQPNQTLIEIAVQYQYETMEDFYAVSGLGANSFISVGQDVVIGYKPVPQSQGGSTDSPTSTPLPPPTATTIPTATPLPTNTPISFPTALPTLTLSAAQATSIAQRDAVNVISAEPTEPISPLSTPIAPANFVPAFIALFGSFVILGVLGWYLWSRQQP